MLRQFPTGPVMQQGDFMRFAMEQPLSPWATFAGSAADAALGTPGLGTAIREGYTPDIAKTPVAGGRGGVQFRYDTPAEVQSRGDTLYQTEEAMKASPAYRDGIPFEKGMTESRLRAMADMKDVQAVREYYGSKRPFTAFAGALAGSALDPVNYIPIAGEAAQAAAVARVGRIAGRALIGGADAAANSALFSLATAKDRARYGDDVSWAAIGMNAAYAAMAGVVIGGGLGAFLHLRGNKGELGGRLGEHQGEGSNIPPVPPDIARPELSTTGDVTARFDTRPALHVNIVDRLETAGNRIKAAEVLNDAVHGLVNDGEVRLGERSQGHVAAMTEAADTAAVDAGKLQFRRDVIGIFTRHDAAELGPEGQSIYDAIPKELRDAAHTFYNSEAGLRESENVLPDEITGPMRAEAAARMDALKPKVKEFQQVVDNLYEQHRAGLIKPVERETSDTPFDFAATKDQAKSNYSAPPPEPQPHGLTAAYSKITVREKPPANPEKAALDRAVADAKSEGFDPETGTHDLEPDIQALREQGVLDEGDEKALAAAEETYQAVSAWEEAMQIARSCVLS